MPWFMEGTVLSVGQNPVGLLSSVVLQSQLNLLKPHLVRSCYTYSNMFYKESFKYWTFLFSHMNKNKGNTVVKRYFNMVSTKQNATSQHQISHPHCTNIVQLKTFWKPSRPRDQVLTHLALRNVAKSLNYIKQWTILLTLAFSKSKLWIWSVHW